MEPAKIRRVVTGHDDTGKAIVLFDSYEPHSVARPGGGKTHLFWGTAQTPAAIDGPTDRALKHPTGIPPAANGSVFRIVDFPPLTDDDIAKLDVNFMSSQIEHSSHATSSKYRPSTHPFMHRTRTVDYAVVMSGETDMLLDEGQSIHLKAGDVLIQQGTNHAWVNRSGDWCRIAFILIDAVDPFA